jgi:hypothetical protein
LTAFTSAAPVVQISTVPPTPAEQGNLWFNNNDGRLYIYYADGSTEQWIDASPDNASEVIWSRSGGTIEPANAGDDVGSPGGLSQTGHSWRISNEGQIYSWGNVGYGLTIADTSSGSAQETIVLNRDGSATFADQVTAGGAWATGNGRTAIGKTGVGIIGNGGSGTIFSVYSANGAPATIRFQENGSATFGSGNITLDANGIASFAAASGKPIELGENLGNGPRIRSMGTYDTTAASADNIVITNSGLFARQSSSIRYKKDVETLEDSYADNILNARPVWYRSRSEEDNPDHGYYGFIAEEIAELEPRLATYNSDGKPEGVLYAQFAPLLLNLIKRQQSRIEALEAEVQQLKGGN